METRRQRSRSSNNLDLNLTFDLNKQRSSSTQSTKDRNEANAQRVFKCKYCNSKFSTSQALGGHQNAHRRERAKEKTEKMLGMIKDGNGLPSYPYMYYPNVVNSSLSWGLSGGGALGLHPMINNQSFSTDHLVNTSNYGSGHYSWYLNQWLNQSNLSNQQATTIDRSSSLHLSVTDHNHGDDNGNSQNLQEESSELDLSLKL